MATIAESPLGTRKVVIRKIGRVDLFKEATGGGRKPNAGWAGNPMPSYLQHQ